MGSLRVTDWQKGIPFCRSDISVQLIALKWPSIPPVTSASERWPPRTLKLRRHVPRAEKDRNPREQPGDPPFGHSLKHGSTLARAQRQHLGSSKSIQTERERRERTREKARNLPYNPIGKAVAREKRSVLLQPLTRCTEVVLLGADAFCSCILRPSLVLSTL